MAIFGMFMIRFALQTDGQESDDLLSDEFKSAVEYARFAYQEYPENANVYVGMLRENEPNEEVWIVNLSTSASDCLKSEVIEFQQMYIDTARSIVLGTPR